MDAVTMLLSDEDWDALREVERAWLAKELARAIANLGYPVGMGIAPSQEHIDRMAGTLADRAVSQVRQAVTAARAEREAS